MGTMSCSRNDCSSTCCDRYSEQYGYICYTCFDELCDQSVTGVINIDTFSSHT